MKGKKYILLKAKIPVWLKYWAYKKGGVTPVLKNLYLGYSRQTNTTGKNKAKIIDIPEENFAGSTLKVQNGIIKINGTTNTSRSKFFETFTTESGNAVFWLEVKGYTDKISGNASLILQESIDNNNFTTLQEILLTSTSNKIRNIVLDNSKFYRIRLYTSENTFTDAEIKVMIEYGTEKTNWERYTGGIPAPNPEYPFEIENLTGNVPIQAGNKVITFPLANGQILFEDTMLTPEGILFQNDNIIFTGTENVVVGSILSGNAGCVYSSNLVAKNTTDSIIVKGNYAIAKKPSVVINGGEVGICSRQGENNQGIYFRIPSTIASTSEEIKSYLAGLYENNKPFIAEYKRTRTLLVPYTEAQLQAYTNLCKYFEENTDLNNYIVGG